MADHGHKEPQAVVENTEEIIIQIILTLERGT